MMKHDIMTIKAGITHQPQKRFLQKKRILLFFLFCIFCSDRQILYAEEMKVHSALKKVDTWEQRAFRDEIPNNQEISATSSLDGTMNVITKGVGSAAVQVKISIPDTSAFTSTIIVQISNDTTGDIYELGVYYENSYSARMNIPEGDYTVIAAMVVNDYSGYYTIPTGQKFTVKQNDSSTYNITLCIQSEPPGQTSETSVSDSAEPPEVPGQPEKHSSAKADSFVMIPLFVMAALLLLSAAAFLRQNRKRGRNRKTNIF